MEINTFMELVKSESAAKKYLLKFCWKNHQRCCPKCKNRRLYTLGEGRKRCSRCAYTFHDFSGRFINTGQFTCVQWLWLIKLFELETPPKVMAQQMGIARNTADKVLQTMRQAVAAHALDAPLYIQMGLLAGARPQDPPVFGIMESRGWAFVDVMQGLGVEGLALFRRNFHLRTVTQGRVVYTDRYRNYDTLVFCAPEDAAVAPFRGSGKGYRGRVYVDGKQGFWNFVRERLRKGRGLGARWFPLYLKELEFRYNQRDEDVFSLLAHYLCSMVPKYE